MIAAILAAALASAETPTPSAPLELRLVCRGPYDDVETESGVVTHGREDGTFATGTVAVSRPVKREGEVRLLFSNDGGAADFYDGSHRVFERVEVAPNKIVGYYSIKRLLHTSHHSVEVDRITGEIVAKFGNSVYFRGTCEAQPLTGAPKF